MARYFITDPAATDLAQIWQGHVDRGGSEAKADRLIDDLFATFQNLADFPDIGSQREYLPSDVLAFPHDRNMVFYRKVDYGVDIAHVLSGGMDFEGYFDEPQE